ncbi:MAG: hypothetical protein ACRDA4_06750 [Filifactoraceae bacterium]
MLKFWAILGGVLASLLLVFMLAINLGWFEPNMEPSVKTNTSEEVKIEENKQTDNSKVVEPKNVQPVEPVKTVVAENGYKDGIYKAESPAFDGKTGWKPIVTVEIKGGEILNVHWDEEYKDGGSTKRELSEKGEYMMTENSIPWHKQAMDAEDYVMDIKNPDEVTKVDAISSVTIDPKLFLDLVKLCLATAKEK